MNVLITNAISFLGGVEIFAIKLGIGLAKLGHEVSFAVKSQSRMEEELRKRGIVPQTLPMTGDLEPVSLYGLSKIMRKKKIDITCTTCPRDFRLAGVMARLHGKRGVVFNMGTVWDPNKMTMPHNFKYFRSKFFFNLALMKGIANSVGGRDYVEQAWSIPRKQLEAIYNGVDLAIFDPTSVQRHALRKEFNFPDDATVVSMIARISPEKGQGLLLDAAQHVLVNIPNTYFVIVGESTSDEYHRTLMSKLSNIRGHDHILFVGFRNDVPNVLADTDVLVLPSSQEGLPNVALEALAMKTPVIASDVCATNEAVKDGVNGFLLKTPIDATELAAKLETLLSDNQLRTTMGERGRNLIEEQFNLENNIKEYEAAFTRLLNEERP